MRMIKDGGLKGHPLIQSFEYSLKGERLTFLGYFPVSNVTRIGRLYPCFHIVRIRNHFPDEVKIMKLIFQLFSNFVRANLMFLSHNVPTMRLIAHSNCSTIKRRH